MSHGMFGWDLPPGVSVSDIPGNRPEDERWEYIYDNFWDKERLTKTTLGTKISEEEYAKMDKIWRSKSKVNMSLVDLIDKYITCALEYGIEFAEKEARENEKMNKQDDRMAVENAFENCQSLEEAKNKVIEYLGLGKS